jgi:hypothetical protein
MSEAAAPSRRELEAQVVARAWADEGFRERLRADPRAAVAEETGVAGSVGVLLLISKRRRTGRHLGEQLQAAGGRMPVCVFERGPAHRGR